MEKEALMQNYDFKAGYDLLITYFNNRTENF
jgi:hypothetical protein